MSTVVVSPYRTLEFLEGGGHFWVYLQYVHGLQQAGCDVYWVEHFRSLGGQETSRVDSLLRRLAGHGLADKVILCTDASGASGPSDPSGASGAGGGGAQGMEYTYIGAT